MMLDKPRRALCIVLMLTTAAIYIIKVWGGAGSDNQYAVDESFTVTQRYYGIDAAEMERVAAIPLEDKLSGIHGLKRIFSSSENGRTRVLCNFEGKEQGRYEAIREAAQQVYESLPKAAQRPEISSSGDSRVPVWTAALINRNEKMDMKDIGTFLEKTVKPALEGLPGAATVEISGTGVKETVITLNSEETAARKIDASDIAGILSKNDVLLPGGTIIYRDNNNQLDREIPIMVDGRIKDLKDAYIPVRNLSGSMDYVPLMNLANVTEQEREFESRSRLNGMETIIISIMGSDNAPLGKLSRQIKEELDKFDHLEFTILLDKGAAEQQAMKSVMEAALQGAFMVAFICAFLCFGKRNFAVICSLTVPVTLLFTAALLILMGFSPDKLVLAGLSAGVGAAVDTAILGAEYFRSCKTIEEGKTAIGALCFPLVSGVLTTVIALLPLMNGKAAEIKSVAWAVASINMVTMVLALTLMPPLFLWGCSDNKENSAHIRLKEKVYNVFSPLFRFYRRKLAVFVRIIQKKPQIIIFCWLIISILGIVSLFIKGADIAGETAEDSVYAQVEFDGGLHNEETDKALSVFGNKLKEHVGIENVQTVARTGTGSVLVKYDPKVMENKKAVALIRDTPVPGGFVYIMESSLNERNWKIKIAGDELSICRELAREAAQLCSAVEIVHEAVLNFKEGSPRLNLVPDRERIAFSAFSIGGIGQSVRRSIHGSVAYKRIDGSGEKDVRVLGGYKPHSKEEVLDILVKGKTVPLKLSSLTAPENMREAGSIQRENRRRSASFSIRTKAMDPIRVRDNVMPVLFGLELPPGYSIEFDAEAIKAAEETGKQAYLFFLALLFCYMIIAALKESFVFPFALLVVVPPSLAVPALCMVSRNFPLNAVSAAAFVAVSGLAINAAALVAGAMENKQTNALSYYCIFRRRLPVLAATTITTVAAAIPFLFIKSNSAMVVKTLSFVSALGVTASALCAVTLIPALVILFPNMLKTGSYRH